MANSDFFVPGLASKKFVRDGFVAKEEGKQLSTEDFTTELKKKLLGLGDYDDTDIKDKINALSRRLDTLVGGSVSDAIDTFNEVESFLRGIADTESLTGMLAALRQEITGEIPTKLSELDNDNHTVSDSRYVHTDNNYTDEDRSKLEELPDREHLNAFLGVIAQKADRTELSNILGNDTEGRIEEIEPGIVTEALRKVPQALTPDEQAIVKNNIGVSKMELFCDMFSVAAGTFGYARITDGEFDCELNGLRLTYEEALNTYFASGEFSISIDGAYAFNNNTRTLIPRRMRGVSASAAWQSCANLEVLVFVDGLFTNLSNAFRSCPKLRKISLIANYNTIDGAFVGCRSLEELTLKNLKHNVSFADSPLLNLTSFEYLIANATNTSTITITVHPDVYAKLTDESNTEWHQVLLDAAEKQITFATT